MFNNHACTVVRGQCIECTKFIACMCQVEERDRNLLNNYTTPHLLIGAT